MMTPVWGRRNGTELGGGHVLDTVVECLLFLGQKCGRGLRS